MLNSKHFDGLRCRFETGGIEFRWDLDEQDRLFASEKELSDDVRQSFASPSKLRVNPRRPSIEALFLTLEKEQAQLSNDEAISIRYGALKRYQRKMKWSEGQMGLRGEQTLVLVALSRGSAVGYTTIRVAVSFDTHERDVFLFLEPMMVYVSPSKRKRGVGLDLSLGCGAIASDVLAATYRATPDGFQVNCSLSADYESFGGELFTQQVFSDLQCRYDELIELEPRAKLDFRSPELDAGY